MVYDLRLLACKSVDVGVTWGGSLAITDASGECFFLGGGPAATFGGPWQAHVFELHAFQTPARCTFSRGRPMSRELGSGLRRLVFIAIGISAAAARLFGDQVFTHGLSRPQRPWEPATSLRANE